MISIALLYNLAFIPALGFGSDNAKNKLGLDKKDQTEPRTISIERRRKKNSRGIAR